MPSRKRKNVKLRKALKELPCLVCGSLPSDPCHLRTFKVTQSDHPANMIPMCRKHHNEQHQIGWKRMIQKYFKLALDIRALGWEITQHPFDQDKVILTHPEVA